MVNRENYSKYLKGLIKVLCKNDLEAFKKYVTESGYYPFLPTSEIAWEATMHKLRCEIPGYPKLRKESELWLREHGMATRIER